MNMPPRCREAVDLLWEYLERGLDDHESVVVERHLAHCVRCCGEVMFARELKRRLLGQPTWIPRDVEERLEACFDDLTATAGGTS